MAINCYGYTKKWILNTRRSCMLPKRYYFAFISHVDCCYAAATVQTSPYPIISTVVKIPSQATVQPIALQNEWLNNNVRQYGKWIWIANLSLLQHTKTYQNNTYLLIPKSDCYVVREVIADSKIGSQSFLQTMSYMLAYLKTNKY
jgi:hypothetical protein